MVDQKRMTSHDWDLFDTRHVVFKPAQLSSEALESGYWRAYEEFYKWNSILRGALAKPGIKERLRHVAYAGGWKKFEPLWDWVIRAKRVAALLPMLETVLTGFGSHPSHSASAHCAVVDGDSEAGILETSLGGIKPRRLPLFVKN
jgi:hypothetical protein